MTLSTAAAVAAATATATATTTTTTAATAMTGAAETTAATLGDPGRPAENVVDAEATGSSRGCASKTTRSRGCLSRGRDASVRFLLVAGTADSDVS